MFVKFRMFLPLLAMISSTVVNAELAIVNNGHSYEIQKNTSKIEFRVDSPVGEVRASFPDFKGNFAILNGGVHNNSAVVDINADSLDTEVGFIGMMLKGESFFDVENFPSIRFVGSSFEWYSETHAVLKGEMTIQNVTRQVAFYVELVDADVENKYSERITVKATTTIRRSEFGLYTLLSVVSDDVNLSMSIDAIKQESAVLVSML